jgi:hypothetical protein
MTRHNSQYGNNEVILGGGGGDGTFTVGDRLIEADVPVETMLGAANGAITGAFVSTAVSAAVTAGQHGSGNLFGNTMRNVTGSHLVGVLAGTAAFSALTALVRFSRARKHNEWSNKHYDFLRETKSVSHVEREARREQEPGGQVR